MLLYAVQCFENALQSHLTQLTDPRVDVEILDRNASHTQTRCNTYQLTVARRVG